MRSTFLLAAAASILAAQDPTGSIQGTVIDSVTRAPVKRAMVTTSAIMAPLSAPPNAPGMMRAMSARPARSISIKTDASGVFSFLDLPPGTYFLNIRHPQYQMLSGGDLRVQLKSGEKASVAIELTPGATITGKVVDEDGDPLSLCVAQLLATHPGEFVRMMGGEPTDSSGVFTLWGVSPGKFRIGVRCFARVLEPWPLHPITQSPPTPTLAYPTLYYPGVPDSQQGQLVEVTAGAVKAGLDFQMRPARVFTVNGTIRAGTADLSKINVLLLPRNTAERAMMGGASANVDSAKGTFVLERVFPGSYILSASVRDGSSPKYGLRQTLDVPAPGPLDLELKSGTTITGRVEVEGDFKAPLNSIGVQLIETEPAGMGVAPATTDKDGAFTIADALPGVYRVEAHGPNVFVKSVSWGGRELPDAVLDLTAGVTGPLRLLLSTNTANIKGTAPANSMVEAIEVTSSQNPARAGTVVDPQGSFLIGGLRPGRYRVTLGPVGAADTPGEEVTVREGETVTVAIRDSNQR